MSAAYSAAPFNFGGTWLLVVNGRYTYYPGYGYWGIIPHAWGAGSQPCFRSFSTTVNGVDVLLCVLFSPGVSSNYKHLVWYYTANNGWNVLGGNPPGVSKEDETSV